MHGFPTSDCVRPHVFLSFQSTQTPPPTKDHYGDASKATRQGNLSVLGDQMKDRLKGNPDNLFLFPPPLDIPDDDQDFQKRVVDYEYPDDIDPGFFTAMKTLMQRIQGILDDVNTQPLVADAAELEQRLEDVYDASNFFKPANPFPTFVPNVVNIGVSVGHSPVRGPAPSGATNGGVSNRDTSTAEEYDQQAISFSGSHEEAPLLAPSFGSGVTSVSTGPPSSASTGAGPYPVKNGPTQLAWIVNDSFRLTTDAQSVFQQLGPGPVYIVALHGIARSGKSTLLSYFVREWYRLDPAEALWASEVEDFEFSTSAGDDMHTRGQWFTVLKYRRARDNVLCHVVVIDSEGKRSLFCKNGLSGTVWFFLSCKP